MTIIRNMPAYDLDFGTFERPDKESFRITCQVHETPPQYDYWLATFDAHHANWGHMRFSVMLPKRLATSDHLANAMLGGEILEQIEADLLRANAGGRDLTVTQSYDGWVIL